MHVLDDPLSVSRSCVYPFLRYCKKVAHNSGLIYSPSQYVRAPSPLPPPLRASPVKSSSVISTTTQSTVSAAAELDAQQVKGALQLCPWIHYCSSQHHLWPTSLCPPHGHTCPYDNLHEARALTDRSKLVRHNRRLNWDNSWRAKSFFRAVLRLGCGVSHC